MFCSIINVFTITFGLFNTSFQNLNNPYRPQTFELVSLLTFSLHRVLHTFSPQLLNCSSFTVIVGLNGVFVWCSEGGPCLGDLIELPVLEKLNQQSPMGVESLMLYLFVYFISDFFGMLFRFHFSQQS